MSFLLWGTFIPKTLNLFKICVYNTELKLYSNCVIYITSQTSSIHNFSARYISVYLSKNSYIKAKTVLYTRNHLLKSYNRLHFILIGLMLVVSSIRNSSSFFLCLGNDIIENYWQIHSGSRQKSKLGIKLSKKPLHIFYRFTGLIKNEFFKVSLCFQEVTIYKLLIIPKELKLQKISKRIIINIETFSADLLLAQSKHNQTF